MLRRIAGRLARRSARQKWAWVEHLVGPGEERIDYVAGTAWFSDGASRGYFFLTSDHCFFYDWDRQGTHAVSLAEITAVANNEYLRVDDPGVDPRMKIAIGDHAFIFAFRDNPLGRRFHFVLNRQILRVHRDWQASKAMKPEILDEPGLPDLEIFL